MKKFGNYMKKMKSIALAAAFSIGALGFYQCTNDDSLFEGFENEPDFETLQDVHDLITQSDTVYFTVTDIEIPQDFNTPGGMRLHFPVSSFGTSGGEVITPIKIKLVELYKRGDIVRHNMQTYTNQNPLVSAGIFWISGTDVNGTEVIFSGVTAYIPRQTDAAGYENNMNYLTGMTQTKPSGIVNSWTASSGTVVFDETAGLNGEYTLDQVNSGWNSAQALYDFDLNAQEPTQFKVQVTNSPGFDKTEVFFTNNDFTVVSALTQADTDGISTFSGSIPKGVSGKLIAISLIDGALNFGTQDVTVNGDDTFTMTVSPGEPAELQALLTAIP